jgi:hypothetical protein
VEAGPQLALQLSLLLKGGWGESSKLVIEPILFLEDEITTTVLPEMTTTIQSVAEITTSADRSLQIFDRVYDEGNLNYLV